MKKRIWSMFLALAMALVMIPALGLVANASEDTTASPTGSVWLNAVNAHSIRVSAVDSSDGYELAGAHLQILDAEGDVVVVEGNKVEWDSTLGTHTIEGLKSGVTYTIRNTTAPAGYVIAKDTTFSIDAHGNVSSTGTVSADGVLLVEFAKTKVEVSAVETGAGESIEGATMQILTVDQDGNATVVEEWTSATEVHEITGLKTGEVYTLRATVAPDGYAMPTDTQFTIDQNGNITSTGTVSEDGVLIVEFSETMVKVSAVESGAGESIEGAHLQILDAKDNIVDEWVSALDDEDTNAVDESVHLVYGLKTGEVYTLRTVTAPAGYAIADDTTFSINENGKIISTGDVTEDGVILSVFDLTVVHFSAVEHGTEKRIAGATMQVLDKNGDVVEEWVFEPDVEETVDVDESIKTITGLNTGETFTLHTTVAPDGYAIPTDTTFSIDAEGNVSSTGTVSADGILLVEFESAVTRYPLYVGMQQFTENLLTITDSNGGTATYDPQTHTLTLNNFTYSGTGKGYTDERAAIFYHGKETLTLHLVGKSSITYSGNTSSNNYGFYAYHADVIFSGTGDLTISGDNADWVSGGIFVYHDLTLSGTGKLNVIGKNGGGISQGIYCAGALTISDGTVNITTGEAQECNGIRGTDGAISVDGGSLNITCGNASNSDGIYTFYGDFVCSDGTVTVTSGNASGKSHGIYTVYGDFVLSDGTVTVTGGIGGTDEGGYSRGIVAQNISVHDGHLTAVGSTAANSVGIYAFKTAALYGGVLEAAGQTQALNMAPAVDSGFVHAAVWYGDNAAAANEAKPIGDLSNNYSQKYVKVAAVEPDTYTVTVPETENGTVTADKTTAAEGETVTITVTPDSGKQVDQVTVKDASGKDVPFTDNGDGTYTYIQPAGDATVEVTMKDIPASNEDDDDDEPTYRPTIEENEGGKTTVNKKNPEKGDKVTITTDPDKGYEVEEISVTDRKGNEIEVTDNGDGTYTFIQPVGKVTIAVTYVPEEADFTDVHQRDYYYDAVNWAVAEEITNGMTATAFAPNRICTRAQVVTFLWRAAGCPAPVSGEMPFVDVPADAYYHDAVLWAVEKGIAKGTSATTFSPDATVTRGQTVTFLWRTEHGLEMDGVHGFQDVHEDAYYHDAVLWAVENAVTNGTSQTTFSPDAECTRAQIVTFLYRCMAE